MRIHDRCWRKGYRLAPVGLDRGSMKSLLLSRSFPLLWRIAILSPRTTHPKQRHSNEETHTHTHLLTAHWSISPLPHQQLTTQLSPCDSEPCHHHHLATTRAGSDAPLRTATDWQSKRSDVISCLPVTHMKAMRSLKTLLSFSLHSLNQRASASLAATLHVLSQA